MHFPDFPPTKLLKSTTPPTIMEKRVN